MYFLFFIKKSLILIYQNFKFLIINQYYKKITDFPVQWNIKIVKSFKSEFFQMDQSA